jgi:hypothetical protein
VLSVREAVETSWLPSHASRGVEASLMKENDRASSGRSGWGFLFFLAGFAGALAFGWLVFPELLYSEKSQPVNFSHALPDHQGSGCEDCHAFREDGSFTGIPRVAKCMECHESPLTESPDEKRLVEEYIQKEKEIPWLVHAYQPDNVHFAHAPHKARGMECTQCHRDVSKETKTPVFRENRLTGYSRSTMKMDQCEKCHAEQGASNNCEICHK